MASSKQLGRCASGVLHDGGRTGTLRPGSEPQEVILLVYPQMEGSCRIRELRGPVPSQTQDPLHLGIQVPGSEVQDVAPKGDILGRGHR